MPAFLRQRSHRSGLRRLRLQFEPLETRIQPAAMAFITEVMSSNDLTLLDEDGDSPDWVELHNGGDAPLDLAGWHLTDDATDLEKWTFPDVTLDPGRFLVVFASDKDRTDADGTELHTNFKLSSSGDYLALVESDGQTIAFEYAPSLPALETDISYGLSMATSTTVLVDDATPLTYHIPQNGNLGTTWTQSAFDDTQWEGASGEVLTAGIGYERTPQDYAALIDTAIPTGTGSFYTRFEFALTSSDPVAGLDLGMIYDDGFVAYLNGTQVAASSNAPSNPQWNSVTGNQRPDQTVIEDYVHFDITQHASLLQQGNNVLSIHGINTSNNSSDLLMIPLLTLQRSATPPSDDAGFFSQPTPGAANGESFDGFVQDTTFSVDRGFFTDPFSVSISTATPDATIVYTLDGSEPAVDPDSLSILNGHAYVAAIPVSETVSLRAAAFKSGYEPTNTDTQTYIFPNDVINQDAQHALDLGMPSNWGSNPADYGIQVVAGHESDFTNSLSALPTLSISLDSDELFDANDGIYTNSTSRGRAWERAASVELIYPDGSTGFQEDAGLRIQGGAFRNYGLTAKNSLRLAFRKTYGEGKLKFPLFGDDAADEFDNLVLRMESNDGWQWAAGEEKVFARDTFGRETQLAMGQPAIHGTRMHVYLNGHYWGLYNPVERPDEGFAETYFGGDKDDYDVIKSGEIQEGSSTAWDTLLSLSASVASATNEADRTATYFQLRGLNPDGSVNAGFANYLDATNYVDYMIANLYGGNSDWPHKNYSMMRDRTDASDGFKFLMWDSEWSLGLRSAVSINRVNVSAGVAAPYSNLRSSAEFRMLFADRIHKHFFNDGALTVANSLDRFDEITAAVEPGLWGESGRWGDQHVSPPKTPDVDWAGEVANLRTNYFPLRSDIVLRQFKLALLYPDVDAVTWNQRGGTVSPNFDIALSAPQGAIYYTTDGSDPRAIGGGINPQAVMYTGSFQLSEPTTVKARVLDGSDWSAIDEAEFLSSVPSDEQLYLRVTEVHYHPAEPDAVEQAAGVLDDGQLEFLELTNTSTDVTIDLADVRFSDGIEASFPSGIQPLSPQGRVLLVRDLAAFTLRYGTNVVDSADYVLEYSGQLSNSGESIQLDDRFGLPIQQFTYADGDGEGEGEWSQSADGRGSSLEVVDTQGDYNEGSNWQHSAFPHGTPGAGPNDLLHGDYDRDNDVDNDDWTYWVAQFGVTDGIGLFADGNVNGVVDAADFTVWRDHLGSVQPASRSSVTRVPRAAPRAIAPVTISTSPSARSAFEETDTQDAEPNRSIACFLPLTASTIARRSAGSSYDTIIDFVFGMDDEEEEDV